MDRAEPPGPEASRSDSEAPEVAEAVNRALVRRRADSRGGRQFYTWSFRSRGARAGRRYEAEENQDLEPQQTIFRR